MEKRKNSLAHKWGPGSFDLDGKVFSWSAYNCWNTYGPVEFAKKYLYGGADYLNPRMMTGRIVADMLESDKEQGDPVLEHLRTFLPHYQHQEYEIVVPFSGLTLVMHLDGFDEDPLKIGEYKTGVKWNEVMVAKHEQLDWYALGVHLKFGVDPGTVPITLTWMPTMWGMNEPLPRPTGEIINFDTQRDMGAILLIGKKILKTWKEINKFCADERESIGL